MEQEIPKTATGLMDEYLPAITNKPLWTFEKEILQLMRLYARIKSDRSYELGYQEALKQLK